VVGKAYITNFAFVISKMVVDGGWVVVGVFLNQPKPILPRYCECVWWFVVYCLLFGLIPMSNNAREFVRSFVRSFVGSFVLWLYREQTLCNFGIRIKRTTVMAVLSSSRDLFTIATTSVVDLRRSA
jgi:hypothetical protein